MSRPSHAFVRDCVFWFDEEPRPRPPLQGTISADAIVVGGGMMGLMCARTLSARGKNVCVLESEICGSGASGRSSGFITPDSELELTDLRRQFGSEGARQLWQFAWGGVEALRHAIRDERIECDFQNHDALFVAAHPRAAKVVRAEHAARNALGFASTLYEGNALAEILGSRAYVSGVGFCGTFGINSFRCCMGLRQKLVGAGVRIFEHSPVTRLLADGVETAAGAVRAPAVIVCADRFLSGLGLAAPEIYHAQTFLGISEALEDAEIARVFPRRPLMVWDTDLIYKYFRLTGDRRLLIGGGTLTSTYSRHEKHDPDAVIRRLTRHIARHFPGVKVKFSACWPGLIGISKDFAPILGRHPSFPAIHFAAGAAGLPWAAALGCYLAEKVLDGRDDLGAILSDQRRFPVGRKIQAFIGKPAAFALSHGRKKFGS